MGSSDEPSWKSIQDPRLGLAVELARKIGRLQEQNPTLLPNMRRASTILVTSDYSGELAGTAYQTYSYLIADADRISSWSDERELVRRRFLTDGRDMSYKGLNDRCRWRALDSFLRAADKLTGVLMTIAVHSSVSFFSGAAPVELTSQRFARYREWSSRTLDKSLRILHFLALLLAGLVSSTQRLMWVTDDDAMAANPEHLQDLAPLLDGVLDCYLGSQAAVEYNTLSRVDEPDRMMADLVAIPDLVAGALAELAPLHGRHGIVLVPPGRQRLAGHLPFSSLFRRNERSHVVMQKGTDGLLRPVGSVQAKTACITDWLGRRQCPLVKLVCMIDPSDNADEVLMDCFPFSLTRW